MKKRIGIYSAHGAFPPALALGKGFASVGYAVNHRSLSDYGGNDRERHFSLVAVFGLRGAGRRILEEYQQWDVPVLVVDYGYLKREEYWQISLNGLNRLPPFECPPRRFAELGLDIRPMVSESNGPAVLAGQMIGDQAHPFDTEKKWNAFVEEVTRTFPDIEYRPHPLHVEVNTRAEPIELLLERAGKIVTWNSNIGNDAWLAGVRVEALSPDAMYAQVTPENRAEYFARVGYGQWREEELSDGSAAQFVVDHILTGTPPTPVEPTAALPPVLTKVADQAPEPESMPPPSMRRKGAKR